MARVMVDGETPEPASEARVGVKRALFERLDAQLAAAGHAVPAPPPPAPPPPAPPPPGPALAVSFEDWAELSIRFAASPEDAAPALSARGVTLEAWKRADAAHRRALSDDRRAGRQELSALYQAKLKEAMARCAAELAPPAASAEGTPPALPTSQRAPEALRNTAGLPELPAPLLASMGRTPFMPPPPEAPATGKPPAKTVQSRAVPSRVGGETMSLDNVVQQRPTPTLPFGPSADSQGVGYVPLLDARQYVALCAELALQPAPREQTWSRYHVPTEAALRALDEHWQHPARRAELENALAEFAVVVRRRVLR